MNRMLALLAGIHATALAFACNGKIDVGELRSEAGSPAESGVPETATSSTVGPDAGTTDGETSAQKGQEGEASDTADSAMVPEGGCSPSESILTCAPTASVAGCWTCAKQVCSSQFAACAQDATCNATIAGALNCSAESGNIMACFPLAIMSTLAATNGDDDTALDVVRGCILNNGACPCLTAFPTPPPDDVDADLPLCSCKTFYGSAMCMQTTSCRVPTCPVGAPCCTPSGLCGCAPNIVGGPDLTCN